MVIYKKTIEPTQGTNPSLTSQKGGTSTSTLSSLSTHEKFPKEDTSQESLERMKPTEE